MVIVTLMKVLVKYILLLTIILFQISAVAQVNENEVKAAYIERFTRFIDWSQTQDSLFVVAVVGKNTLGNSLDILFEEETINDVPVVVNYYDDYHNVNDAQVIFISKSEKKNITNIIERFSDSPVLLVSDTKGYANAGSHINMYRDNNHIKFEINPNAISKSGLKVSSLLLASAKIVETDE